MDRGIGLGSRNPAVIGRRLRTRGTGRNRCGSLTGGMDPEAERSIGGIEPVEVTGFEDAGRVCGADGFSAAHADTARSIRAERTESPGNAGSGEAFAPPAFSVLGFCSPSSLRAALFRQTTELSCMFQVHSAWISRPAEVKIATICHGSSPRRVDFQVTDSMPMDAAAKVRSTSSLMVRTLLSFGAGTVRNCSIAYCFSVSTAAEKRRTSVVLSP